VTSTPHRIATFGSLTIGVTDLDLAVDFYARIARLEPTETRPTTVFMSGGREHHWLRLEQTEEPDVQRVSFQAVDRAAIDAVTTELDARSIPWRTGADFRTDRLVDSIQFTDPAGVPMELYTGMAELPVAVAPNGVALREMLHTLWVVPDLEAEIDFLSRVLGFQISDRLENQVAFLHCADRYHHSLALAQGPPQLERARFAHFCILVDHVDDVMRFRYNAVAHDLHLEHDLLRHPTSGSMGVYVTEPTLGFSVEFCTGHQRIEAGWEPRRLTAGPAMIDVWQQPLPPPRIDSKVPFNVMLAARDQAPGPQPTAS
jgi:2,3-dihydroxy-p-cumate/2,3-dihydroxybenzoate 3,4-dioxygenase